MSIRRLYESTFIINAALEDPDVEAVIRRVTDYIENHGERALLAGSTIPAELVEESVAPVKAVAENKTEF